MHGKHPVRSRAGTRILQLGLLGLLAVASSAGAASVWRCESADGAIAFQDGPCTAAARATQVPLAPLPPPVASPEYRLPATAPARTRLPARRPPAALVSWRCEAANGEVFYRHARCPATIRTTASGARGASASVRVSATPLPRSEACRLMRRTRPGHERDERVSTYERNAGRDACRRS
jgi:hypothetical protein